MELSQTTSVLLSVTSFVVWSALLGMLCLAFPHKSHKWSYRVVVTVNSLAMLATSAACELFNDTWRFSIPGQPSSDAEVLTLDICLGYYTFDLIHSLYRGKTWDMVAHHAICVLGITVGLISGVCGAEMILCLFLGELTSPPLQLRWFLRDAGMADHILYEVTQVTFMVMFGVVRMGLGSYLAYLYLKNPVPHAFFKIAMIILWLVSAVFMVEISKLTFKRFVLKKRV